MGVVVTVTPADFMWAYTAVNNSGLALSVADNAFTAENVVLKKYYDWGENKTLGKPIAIEGKNEEGYHMYSYETKDDELPLVKYTYALEWEVVKK